MKPTVTSFAARPRSPTHRFEHLIDPVVVVMYTESGVRIDDEVNDEVLEAVSGRLGTLHAHLDDLLTQEPAHRVDLVDRRVADGPARGAGTVTATPPCRSPTPRAWPSTTRRSTRSAVRGGGGQWLLAQDVLAGLDGLDDVGGVDLAEGGNEDGVAGPGRRSGGGAPRPPPADDCIAIMEAEQKAGKKLVTVGFMRRFDAAYNEMKKVLDDGDNGQGPLRHHRHRKHTQPARRWPYARCRTPARWGYGDGCGPGEPGRCRATRCAGSWVRRSSRCVWSAPSRPLTASTTSSTRSSSSCSALTLPSPGSQRIVSISWIAVSSMAIREV